MSINVFKKHPDNSSNFCTVHWQTMWCEKNKAIVDIRLHAGPMLPPGKSYWCQICATLWRVTFSLHPTCVARRIGPFIGENMASPTKPEVHSALQSRQRRTNPRPYATCTANLVKFGYVIREICTLNYICSTFPCATLYAYHTVSEISRDEKCVDWTKSGYHDNVP